MENKVCCKETKCECINEMNDRDLLDDVLASEKAITTNTSIALVEASNNTLEQEIFEFFETSLQLQREAYELAWNNGWYTLEEVQKTKLGEKAKSLQKKYDEFSE